MKRWLCRFLPGFCILLLQGQVLSMDFLPVHKGDYPFPGGAFPDTVLEGTPYVSGTLLNKLVGGNQAWKEETSQWMLRDRRSRDWIFTLDNPFASIGGELFNLTFPPRRVEGRLFLPLHPLLRLFRVRFSIELSPVPQGDGGTVFKVPDSGKESSPVAKLVPAKPFTVIVDAGHGGHDRGATIKGTEEAVITLSVAEEFGKELKERGYRVLFTRTTDTFKTLPERPKYASDSSGNLFLSLHCNSLSGSVNRLKTVRGYVAYILREGESEEDKALARRENEAVQLESGKAGKSEIAPVDWILLEHQLNLFSKQSETLTESIVKSFEGFEIPKYSTGARQAGFFVLVGAYMPAVLFEMGFLTHEEDRRILNSKAGQKEIAKRLAKAVDRFRKKKI